MPYKVVKSGSGYKVKNKDTGKTYSKKPIPKKRADAQLRALYASSESESPLIKKIDDRLKKFDNAGHAKIKYIGKVKPCDSFLDRVLDKVNDVKYDVEDRRYVEKPEFLAMVDNLLNDLEELRSIA